MNRMRATCSLAAALLLCGAAFDSPSLYVPGIGLLLLVVVAFAWVEAAIRGASVERLEGAWTVVEGERYRVATRVRPGRIRPPQARLSDPLIERSIPVDPSSGVVETEARFERRGRRLLPAVALEISDPFRLRVARLVGSERPAVLVLPRVEGITAAALGGRLARGGGGTGVGGEEGGQDAQAVDFEPDGLRPYRVGTPGSRIHWRSVARSGELVEHRLVSGGGSEPLLVLDAYRPDGREALDRAVRAAASLCLALARAGGCNVLLPDRARPIRLDSSLRAWPEVHARLAQGRGVEADARPPAKRFGRLLGQRFRAGQRQRSRRRRPRRLSGHSRRPGGARRLLGRRMPSSHDRERPGRAVDGAGCVIELTEGRLRLAAFAAIAAFTAANWVALVSDPPVGRSMIAALCAASGAAALVATAERVPSRWRAAACAGLIVVAIACFGALALGLPVRLLLPSGWGELGGELGDGIGSLGRADYPYDGGDAWSRLALLLALAPLLALAAALSFWPRPRSGRWMRRCGLAVLLVSYGIAATVSPPSHPLLNGALLFALLAAALWSPPLGRRGALLSIGLIGAVALVAIPCAAKLDGSSPGSTIVNGTSGARPPTRWKPLTGTKRTGRSTGSATAATWSRSEAQSRTTGPARCSTTSTARPGSGQAASLESTCRSTPGAVGGQP